jgi:excisionase family DNA binding protein
MKFDKILYRPGEVFGPGKLIPVSRATGYELLRTQSIASIRVGRSILIPAESIENWITHGTLGASNADASQVEL